MKTPFVRLTDPISGRPVYVDAFQIDTVGVGPRDIEGTRVAYSDGADQRYLTVSEDPDTVIAKVMEIISAEE